MLIQKQFPKAQKILRDHSRKEAEVYTGDDYAFMKNAGNAMILMVLSLATPWFVAYSQWRFAAMRAGKYPGVEVSAANTIEECWGLSKIHLKKKPVSPCMILENVLFLHVKH